MDSFAAASLTASIPYCGVAPSPAELAARWNLDPPLVAALLLGAWLFARRGNRVGIAALAVLALAFVSPLCAAASALFAARSIHHLLIVAVAAPLLAAALPAPRARANLAPLPALALATATFWAWHLPAAYAAALSDTLVYWLMQGLLLGSAVVFWRAVRGRRDDGVTAVLALVLAAMQMGLLGALLTFAPVPLYSPHAVAPFLWGITPLADQQLAGLVMWVPGMLPYAVAIGLLVRRAALQGAAGRT